MPVERREQAIAVWIGSTGNGRNPIIDGRRRPSCDGTSRMTRECQVRICERLGVKFPGPTRHGEKNSKRAFLVCFVLITEIYAACTGLTHANSRMDSETCRARIERKLRQPRLSTDVRHESFASFPPTRHFRFAPILLKKLGS
jgi:hypothetical protein